MSIARFGVVAALAASGLLAGAALAAPKKTKADPAVEAARQEADRLYANTCAMCHGDTGKGDGPTGKVLNPRPASFADPAFWKSRTDEELSKIILGGGMSVGKSPLMPGQPQLKTKPEVLKALLAKLRGFASKK